MSAGDLMMVTPPRTSRITCSVPGCHFVSPGDISIREQIEVLKIHSTANHPPHSRPLSKLSSHDVKIYHGSHVSCSASRLQLGAQSSLLRDLLTSLNICDGCNETAAIIFPEEDEDENTLRETFRRLTVIGGRTGFSIVKSK